MHFNKDIVNIIYKYTPLCYNIIIDNKVYYNNLQNISEIDDIIEQYLINLYPYHYERNDYYFNIKEGMAPYSYYKLWNITKEEFLKGINYMIDICYIQGNQFYEEHEILHIVYIKANKYRLHNDF